MSFELKDNSGSIWVNDRKERETHPDRTGTVKVGGREYYISGWLKETSQGKKYLSLSFKPKLASDRGSPPTGGRNDPRPQEEFQDDVPF